MQQPDRNPPNSKQSMLEQYSPASSRAIPRPALSLVGRLIVCTPVLAALSYEGLPCVLGMPAQDSPRSFDVDQAAIPTLGVLRSGALLHGRMYESRQLSTGTTRRRDVGRRDSKTGEAFELAFD